MDKGKAPVHGGGGSLPPHSSHFSTSFAALSSNFPALGNDPLPSESSEDINLMPDFPSINPDHCLAHLDMLGVQDDISFYSDLGVVEHLDDIDEDLAYFDIEMFNSCPPSSSGLPGGEPSGSVAAPSAPSQPERLVSALNEGPGAGQQHSQSMDGSASVLPGSCGKGPGPTPTPTPPPPPAEMQKDAKLADLALADPKRAKRIWAKRQSATRSKERKMRYMLELEQNVQNLQTDATALSSHLTMLQKETNSLTVENSELKLQLQTVEQQVHMQDALNDALQDEVQRLKLATGQSMPNSGPMMSFGPPSFEANQQFYHQNQAMQSFLQGSQLQQHHIHSQNQQQMHPLQTLQQQQQHPHQHQQ